MPIQVLPNEPRPSRREFLAGLAAGAAALAAGRSSRPTPARDDWFALVSDTHIGADPAARLRGQVMGDNLRSVVADIMAADGPPLGVVIDGDLALLDGQEGDYRTLVTLLEPLRAAKVPLHLALGNHDDRAHFRDALRDLVPGGSSVADKEVAVVDGPGVRFVILDSLDRVNGTPGKLGAAQLEWLAGALDARPKDPTMVFVHHNLSNESKTALTDTAPLLNVLAHAGRSRPSYSGTPTSGTCARKEGCTGSIFRPWHTRSAPASLWGGAGSAPPREGASWSCAASAATGRPTASASRCDGGVSDRPGRPLPAVPGLRALAVCCTRRGRPTRFVAYPS